MSSTMSAGVSARRTEVSTVSPALNAYRILHFGFTVLPIVAGLDKFFNLLTDWTKYLPSVVTNMFGGSSQALMLAVGAVEIVAGLGVALRPRIFSYVVAGWLALIILNLLLIPAYFDIALRDFGLLLGALALGHLSREFAKR